MNRNDDNDGLITITLMPTNSLDNDDRKHSVFVFIIAIIVAIAYIVYSDPNVAGDDDKF